MSASSLRTTNLLKVTLIAAAWTVTLEIAERLGHERFFELLRELFQDVTKPVLDSLGEMYQYVSDEVVITRPFARGLKDGNCIACFFRIESTLAARRAGYLERFGIAPEFKAGVHMDDVTVVRSAVALAS